MTDAGGRWLCHECGENVQLAGAHDEPACSQCGGTFMEHFEGPPLQPPPLGEQLEFEVRSSSRATLKPFSPLSHSLPLRRVLGYPGGLAFPGAFAVSRVLKRTTHSFLTPPSPIAPSQSLKDLERISTRQITRRLAVEGWPRRVTDWAASPWSFFFSRLACCSSSWPASWLVVVVVAGRSEQRARMGRCPVGWRRAMAAVTAMVAVAAVVRRKGRAVFRGATASSFSCTLGRAGYRSAVAAAAAHWVRWRHC
jgi:hypothetical protein